MSYNSINICSKALLILGANSISSFNDGTAEAEVAGNLYSLVRDSLLSSYTWSFAVAQRTLAKLENSPLADYQNAFSLPSDFLRVISGGSGNRGRGLQYCIQENRLHTNQEEVNLTYIFRPDESTFPAFFVEALISKLAAEMCLPLTESTSRAGHLADKSEKDINKARLIDSQQATPKRFEDFTLVEIRK